MRGDGSIGADLMKGAIAGAVATWVMDKVTTTLHEKETTGARRRENRARRGRVVSAAAAEKGARIAGTSLTAKQRRQTGAALHWTLGIGAGAAYGVLRRRVPNTGRLVGLSFGTGFWLVLDEVVVPALGLAPGPRALPWQTHARGLAGHLSFGAVTDATLKVLDRLA